MGVIDKHKFESRRGFGCSNSDYVLRRTSCCGAYCVEDDELLALYLDPTDMTRTFNLWGDEPCPFCQSSSWELLAVDELEKVPGDWKWAGVAG
jgi:hypothetical protein